MTSLDFCYWLQGLFELQDPVELNAHQTELIKRHLNMVFAYDPQPSNYCAFLNGFFKIQNPESISAEQTQVIKTYLNNIFEHVAQPVKEKNTTHQNSGFEALC